MLFTGASVIAAINSILGGVGLALLATKVASLATGAALAVGITAVLGLVLGLVFAWVALGTLAVQSGLGDGAVFGVPWAELGSGVAAAALVGLLASVVPGRQAARVEIAAPLTAAG